MAKQSSRPKGGHLVRSYAELDQYVTAFSRGVLNLLIVIGKPGLAKSQSFKQSLKDAIWLEGNATPFGMYCALYSAKDRLVVIDDVDSLYSSTAGVRLLKCVCQTDPVKRIAWQSAAAQLDKEGIPREFSTTSKVAILANDWKTLNDNVAAVQDRGHVLIFDPTPQEIHRRAKEWFHDEEIYLWFGQNLHLLAEHSLRNYVRAAELKAAGMDWKKTLPLKQLSAKALLAARLRDDPSYPNEEARAQAFVALGGGCRATYFNHLRRLKAIQSPLQSPRSQPGAETAA